MTLETVLRTVEANGMRLAYVDRGKGQPVVFVHGGLNDYRVWTPQVQAFAENYRAISYSRRCAYPNKYLGDYMDDNIANNAEDLAAMVRNLSAAPAHIVGHSYGGFIAILCALRHPELVRTLVLGEPAMVIPLIIKNPRNPLEFVSLFLRKPSTARSLMKFGNSSLNPAEKAVRRGDTKEATRIFVNGVLGKQDGFEHLPEAIRSMTMDNAESIRGELSSGVMNTPFNRSDARRITVPVLLVKGELSPQWLKATVDILAEWLPNNEVATLPGVSHTLQIEKPGEFNEKVLGFLSRHT